MELEEFSIPFNPPKDPRPHLPEPPVVRVEAVEDVRLATVAGLERELDAFYVQMLKFERIADPKRESPVVYKAENVLVRFDVVELPPEREDFRVLQIEIPHFRDFLRALDDQEIPYEWQRGVTPGTDAILLRDPAGNWISVGWRVTVR